jgi:hypothetical protein
MKLYNNDTVFNNSNTPEKHSPINQRMLALALIAIPCLLIAFGLVIDTLTEASIINANLTYLLFIVPTGLVVLDRTLFKNNSSHLSIASKWTLKSYEESIAGLDERERQVVDQAYRMSYRIIALICWLAFSGVFANIYMWHLTYRPGLLGVVCLMFGIIDLLSYLPPAIVIWKEEA